MIQQILIHKMREKKKEAFKKEKDKKNTFSHSALMAMIKDENHLKNLYRQTRSAIGKKKPSLYKKLLNFLLNRKLNRHAKKIKLTYFKQ